MQVDFFLSLHSHRVDVSLTHGLAFFLGNGFKTIREKWKNKTTFLQQSSVTSSEPTVSSSDAFGATLFISNNLWLRCFDSPAVVMLVCSSLKQWRFANSSPKY